MTELAVGLRRGGCDVSVFVRRPVRRDHPYLLRMRAAGVAVDTPPRWYATLFDPPRDVREAARALLVTMGLPVLAPLALMDAVLRRRSLERAWRGATGRWHGIASRWAFADSLSSRMRRSQERARRARPVDIVDVQHSMVPSGIRYAAERGIPVVYTEYGAPSRDLESVWAGLRPVIGLADLVIGRAEASIDGLASVCGFDRARPWTIVPNAVLAAPAPEEGAPRLPPDDEGVVITTIGRLSPEKGTPDALAAFRELVRAGLPVRLVLAGDGPLRRELERQVTAWGLADRVSFTGAFDGIEPILRATHVVAHPTHNDGRSVAVLEAMAWGRPVVGTATGGVAELIRDGETGLTVPVGDVEALATALARLVTDRAARERMGAAGRTAFLAGGYTVDEMVERTFDAYARVIERGAEARDRGRRAA